MDVFILDQVVHRSCGISFGFALGNDGLPDLDRLLNVGGLDRSITGGWTALTELEVGDCSSGFLLKVEAPEVIDGASHTSERHDLKAGDVLEQVEHQFNEFFPLKSLAELF